MVDNLGAVEDVEIRRVRIQDLQTINLLLFTIVSTVEKTYLAVNLVGDGNFDRLKCVQNIELRH